MTQSPSILVVFYCVPILYKTLPITPASQEMEILYLDSVSRSGSG